MQRLEKKLSDEGFINCTLGPREIVHEPLDENGRVGCTHHNAYERAGVSNLRDAEESGEET
jgi:hypothetical protein